MAQEQASKAKPQAEQEEKSEALSQIGARVMQAEASLQRICEISAETQAMLESAQKLIEEMYVSE